MHFAVAWALCGAALLCLAASWPPLRLVAPTWLWLGLALPVLPVLGWAVVRGTRVRMLQRGNGSGYDLVRYLLLLPRGLLAAYAAVLCLGVLGLLTAGGARDVRTDAAGHYTVRHDAGRTVQVGLDEAQYRTARAAAVRVATAVPAVLYAAGSLVVLVSATAAVARERPRPAPLRRGTGRS